MANVLAIAAARPDMPIFGLFGLGTISQEARRAVFGAGVVYPLFRHCEIAP